MCCENCFALIKSVGKGGPCGFVGPALGNQKYKVPLLLQTKKLLLDLFFQLRNLLKSMALSWGLGLVRVGVRIGLFWG